MRMYTIVNKSIEFPTSKVMQYYICMGSLPRRLPTEISSTLSFSVPKSNLTEFEKDNDAQTLRHPRGFTNAKSDMELIGLNLC